MVTLTENAGEKLKVLLAEEADDGDGLRVQVVPGGCSGFEYQLTFGKPQSDDEIVEQYGVRIIIDRFSAPYLFGAEFDYEESFQGAGFSINNPNSSSLCGLPNVNWSSKPEQPPGTTCTRSPSPSSASSA